jgi:hypothetical protein
VLSGDIEHAYMNADGDVAYIWDIQANTLETLFVNDHLLLKETDLVDLTGDGVVDANKRLANFTGISSLTMSDRDNNGLVKLYFVADVDTAGTASATDDVEAFFCLEAPTGTVAVALESFEVAGDIGGGVSLAWTTSREAEHAGFHVYRGEQSSGPFERLTAALVTGGSPYRYVDREAPSGATLYYRLGAVDRRGREEMMGMVSIVAGGRIARTELLPNAPNPFVASTDLRFALVRTEPVRLSIFDTRGRLVRVLSAGERPAGVHVLRWDGRDTSGRTVASGSYVCKLETPSAKRSIKITRLVGN